MLDTSTITTPSAKAAFNFIDCPANTDGSIRFYNGKYTPQDPSTPTNPKLKTIQGIEIRDMRGAEDNLLLEQHGMQILKSPDHGSLTPESKRSDIINYLSYICTKVKEVLNAENVICWDYKFRKDDPEVMRTRKLPSTTNDRTFYDPPSQECHVDSTTEGGPRRIRRYLSDEEIYKYFNGPTKYRKRIINVWRPMRDTVKQRPLAYCSPFTVRSEDLIPIQIHVSSDNQGELYWLRHDERQQWFWLSDQTPEEIILFLSYDSDYGNGPRCVPHNSFALTDAPSEVPARESLEARLIVMNEMAE